MKRELPSRYADALVSRSKLIIALVLVITVIVGAGTVVGSSDEGGIGQAGIDSEAQAALEEIEATYGTDDTMVAQIVVRDEKGDVLTRKSLLKSLRLQRELRQTESINETLQEKRGIVGIENIVATFAYAQDVRGEHASAKSADVRSTNTTNSSAASALGRSSQALTPTLEEQIEALESRSPAEVEALLQHILAQNTSIMGVNPYKFLPSEYEPGTTHADARITVVFQDDRSGPNEVPQKAYDAQLTLASLVEERFDNAFVFGQGIIDDASSQAIGDSFIIITPIAIVLLFVVLSVAYRDLVDVLISVFGIAIVMVWYAGIQGWLGIPSSSILIAVPFLLVGLSLDYSLHVVMRYREAREGSLDTDDESIDHRDPSSAMQVGVTEVVLALAAAAFTTAIGFLSNYISPLGSLQDFAILSAAGIVAMFVVFTALVPAVKLELERFLDRHGRERRKSATGVESGWMNRILSDTASLSRRVPAVIIVISLLMASAGVYGATDIDTEFNQADFLPKDAPNWMESLPEPFAPSDYDVRANLEYLSDHFRQRGQGSETQILIHGNITDPSLLTAIDDAVRETNRKGTIAIRPDGTVAIESPVTVLRSVADENETVATAIQRHDSDGDGLPDKDITAIYDLLFEVAPDRASSVLHRENGSYVSARLIVSVQTDASAQSVASDVRNVSSTIDQNAPVRAIATGGPVITAVIQSALFKTLVKGFAITLGVILAFLVGLYWWRHRAPGLGVVIILPVLIALAWLLGTMSVLDIPFNSETVVITSLAIGLGVDYSIHLSERFIDERARRDSLQSTLSAALTGTGGALLGSAVTTACGFGILALSLSPPLHRFGTVTGLSIVYAFVACVTVLPSLLVVRERIITRLA
jgi:hydrophobe/amphiphile efflux-3 (HAE3) family protein